MKNFLFFLAILATFTVSLIFVFNNASKNKTVTTKIKPSNQNVEILSTKSDDIIKIGVAAMISPKETLEAYEEIINYIGKKLGKNTEMVFQKNYAAMNEKVKNQEVDAAFVCSGPYVDGKENNIMEIVAAPQAYGETVYYSYIITHIDSPIKNFSELRDKKFAFTDPLSNTGALVPTFVLAKQGEKPKTYFDEVIYSGSHDKSIEAVAYGLVDGAAVDHLIWEFLDANGNEYTKKTKIIEKHGPFGIPPIVVHPDANQDFKNKLKNILLNISNDPEGRKIIEKIEIDKFMEIDDSAYDSVREMKAWENKVNTTEE